MACLMSLSLSLLAGRKARAWFQPSAHQGATFLAETERTSPGQGHVRFATAPREHPARQASALGETTMESDSGAWTAVDVANAQDFAGQPLELFDVNTHQRITLSPFAEQGEMNPGAFDALSRFLRCRRTGELVPMSPRLIALLSRIGRHFSGAALHVISGHRAVDGITTRRTSQHARGTAADIRIPGVSTQTLWQTARTLGAAGVGLYTKNRFVHVDVRAQPYFWSDAIKRKVSEADEEAARDAELDADATSAPVMPVEAPAALPEPAAP